MYHGAVSRRSGLSWILAALCIAGLVNVRSDVAADVGSLVVGRGPIFPGCPPGSREARGGYCVEDACDSTEPLRRDGRTYTCGLLRVCTEVREVVRYDWMAAFVWEERVPMVVETCAVDAGCDGRGDRTETTGRFIPGSRRCRSARVWIPAPLPPLASRPAAAATDED